MATVTGFTSARSQAIEDGAIVDGDIVGDNLILTKHNGSTINAGNVRGPAGPTGPAGAQGVVWKNDLTSIALGSRQIASGAPGPTVILGPVTVSPLVVGRRYRYSLSGVVTFGAAADIGYIRVYHGATYHSMLYHGFSGAINSYHDVNRLGRTWIAGATSITSVTLQMFRPTGTSAMTLDTNLSVAPINGAELWFDLIDVGALP